MKLLTNLDLSRNEIKNVVIHNLPSHPSEQKEGQVYFNTSQNQHYAYRNGKWTVLGSDSIADIIGLQDALDSKGSIENEHNHKNKTILDGIDEDRVTKWDNSVEDAKDYTDAQILEINGGAPSSSNSLKKISDILDAHKESIDTLDALAKTKADDEEIKSILATKANLVEVNNELSAKADAETVNSELEKKALKSVVEQMNVDLSNAINTKMDIHAHPYKSENWHPTWNDVTDKPTIPTKTSQLTNDSNFLTEHQDISGKADKTELHSHSNKTVLDGITSAKITSWDNKSTFSGSYNDLSNKPTIPTKVSQLTNDKGYITSIPSEYVTETELNAKGYATVNQMNNKADKVTGVFYIEGNSTTDGVWTGNHEDITEYYSGLMINYKTNVAGVSGGSTLNINNLGAVQVVRNVSTAVTTTYAVGCIINLTYTVDNGTAYWKVADYDVNTKNTTGTSNKTGSKMYIVGATSQTSSGTTTYTNTNCYIGTDNKLYSGGNKVIDSSDMTNRDRLHTSLIPSGTNIPADSDLNTIDFVKVGSYKCGTNANAKTLLNCPTKQGFMMEVCSPLSTTLDNEATETWVYRLRTIIDYNGNEWCQYTYSNGTVGNFIYGDWKKKAKVGDIPTKTSQLTNDSNFITSENINSLFDIDYDSLLAFDTNEIITNSNYVDSDNNIILDDDLPSGTYTLKYEFEDGTYTDIKSFTIGGVN